MINEVQEVKEYLDGKNINKNCIYRICYMLAKWYSQNGYTHIEIRKKIFEWGAKYDVYIKYNLNSIIYQALSDKRRLREATTIKISEKDIREINSRFDSKNSKLTALAVLCIAKCSTNRDKEFNMSLAALANWVGISNSTISGRTIPELVDFGMLSKVEKQSNTYSWQYNNQKIVRTKVTTFKINIDISNEGEYELKDNNIVSFYNKIFQN